MMAYLTESSELLVDSEEELCWSCSSTSSLVTAAEAACACYSSVWSWPCVC